MSHKLLAAGTIAATLIGVPAHAQTCTPFTDVAASNIFCSNIQWMFNRGVTLGCGANVFCPADLVTREQMTAFMNRLADKVVFQQGGNAFGAAAELGTTDNQPLEVVVNNARVMRLEPHPASPNIIGGYSGNALSLGVYGATIAGGGAAGSVNQVTDFYGTVGGGISNRATGGRSTVAGGEGNAAGGLSGVVAGGIGNATGPGVYSTVGGGFFNSASGDSATVPGGSDNFATARDTVALGVSARADQARCVVVALWGFQAPISCLGSESVFRIGGLHGFSVDYFSRRPDGGGTRWVYIGDLFSNQTIATWTGAFLSNNGIWQNASDANGKDDFAEVDKRAVLDKLAALPIRSWRYKADAGARRHIGPTAQEFAAAFGVGDSDKSIGTLDADGIALAAIQGLNAKVEQTSREYQRALAQRDARIDAQQREIGALKAVVASFLQRPDAARTDGGVRQSPRRQGRISAGREFVRN